MCKNAAPLSEMSVTLNQLMQQKPKLTLNISHENTRTRAVVIVYVGVLCSVKYSGSNRL